MFTKPFAAVLLVASILFVSASQLLIKSRLAAHGIGEPGQLGLLDRFWLFVSDPLLILAAVLIFAAAAFWYVAMVSLPLGVMLPATGAIAPIVAIAAHYTFGEILDAPRIAAIAMIGAGVAWLAWLNA